MALPYAMLGRSGRAASAVRLYRQAASEIRAGDDATFYHSLPDTHAGAVRTHCLPCGDRRSGTGVIHSDAGLSPQANLIRRHPVRGCCGLFCAPAGYPRVNVKFYVMKRTEVVNIRYAACDVYIGRAGHGEDGYFRNPFRLLPGMSRGATLDRYRSYFYGRLRTDTEFRRRIHALKGKRLGCFCKPYPCHGDIIKEYLDTLDDE